MAADVAARGEPLLLFRAGGERLGIAARAVREVSRVPRLAAVPQAPAEMIGLANLRGSALPVLSTTMLLDRGASPGERLIVLAGDDPVGLLVDGVEAIGHTGDAPAIDPAALIGQRFGEKVRQRRTARATTAEARAEAAAVEQRVLLAFRIGSQEFALPLAEVEEVIRVPVSIDRSPDGDAGLIGMTGWRDGLLPILSLAILLGFVAEPSGAVIVTRIGRGRIGLAVGAISGVVRIAERDVDPLPAVLARGGGEARVQAIGRLEGGRRLISILGAEHVLRDVSAGEISGAAAPLAPQSAEAGEGMIFFALGKQEFALPIAAVRELAPMPRQISRVPLTAAFAAGLMNLRGRALPVIDLAQRLLGRPAEGRQRRVIVVEVGGTDVGLLVDRVSDVRRVPRPRIQAAPALAGGESPLFERIATADDEITLIASPRPLLEQAERDLLVQIDAA